MKLKLDYTSPLDEAQVASVAKQIKTKTEEMKSRVNLSKVITVSVIVLFILGLLLISVSAIYGDIATDKELKSVAKKLAAMPFIGSIAKWCFRNVLLKFKDAHAVLRSSLIVIGIPLVSAILIRIVGEVFISRKQFGSEENSDDGNGDKSDLKKLKKELSDLMSLSRLTSYGARPVKIISAIASVSVASYLFYSMRLAAKKNADIAEIVNSKVMFFIILAVATILLFLALIAIIYLFLRCLRPLYAVGRDKNSYRLEREIENLEEERYEKQLAEERRKRKEEEEKEKRRLEEKRAEERRRLEAMSDEELYDKASALPLWSDKAVQMMRIAAGRGYHDAKTYLSTYEKHLEEERIKRRRLEEERRRRQQIEEEQRKEKMMSIYKEGRSAEGSGDYITAKSKYKTSADMGHPDGMYNYARLSYRNGNVYEAKRYLKMSIDSGVYNDEHTRALLRALESGQHIDLV